MSCLRTRYVDSNLFWGDVVLGSWVFLLALFSRCLFYVSSDIFSCFHFFTSNTQRSRRYGTCKAYKTKKRTRRQRKNGMIGGGTTKLASTATATATAVGSSQLKDPPSYSIIAKEVVEDVVSEQQNQSSSSQPESSEAASKSISEDTQSQKDETNESNSDSKTSNNTKETTIAKPGTSAGEENDSMSSRQKEQRQESDVKTQIPPESDTTVQQNAETKETLDKSSTENISVLPREERKRDIGLETAGISTNILGLTIEKQQQQQSATENDTNNDPEDESRKQEGNPVGRRSKKYIKKSRRSFSGVVSRTKYDCHVLSMGIPSSSKSEEAADTKMILDMYAYHQGREGMEARDAETGELLFSQQVTDTNHDFDAPKSTFSIEIEFPLEDDEDEADEDFLGSGDISHTTERLESENKNSENGENFRKSGQDNNIHIPTTTTKSTGKSLKKKNLAMYQETLTWDLIDPNTPTPLDYASTIGKEYGLSFGQTMDLAARIDKQIQKHVTETSQYREAIATRDTIQELSQPRKLGPICQPYRYDEIVQTEKEGGTFRPKRERHSRQPRSSACGGALVSKKNRKDRSSPTTETLAKASSTTERNKTKKNAPSIPEVNLEDELDDDLLEEVKKRSTAEPIAVSGVMKAEKNAICHICKKRMPMGYHFPCPNGSHVYCDMHVEVSLFYVCVKIYNIRLDSIVDFSRVIFGRESCAHFSNLLCFSFTIASTIVS